MLGSLLYLATGVFVAHNIKYADGLKGLQTPRAIPMILLWPFLLGYILWCLANGTATWKGKTLNKEEN